MRITADHADHYREHGYVAVPGFVDAETLAAVRRDIALHAPAAADIGAAPKRYAPLLRDPGLLQWDFPFSGDTLNRISIDEELIGFAEDVLDADDVLLMQSILWAKYAGTVSFDQELHVDYDENTLVYPRGDSGFDQLLMLIYYTDITPEMGPTYIVPWEGGEPSVPPDGFWPPYRSRDAHAGLYAKERPVHVEAGTLLMMSIRTFHRGSRITAASGARYTHHLGFCSGSNPWMGRYRQWPHYGTDPGMGRILVDATPRQRTAIGFPPPGHAYWNEATLAGVAARYPGIDLADYAPATAGVRA